MIILLLLIRKGMVTTVKLKICASQFLDGGIYSVLFCLEQEMVLIYLPWHFLVHKCHPSLSKKICMLAFLINGFFL